MTATQLPVKRTVVTLKALAAALWAAWPEAEDVDVAIVFGKLIAENGWPKDTQTTWNWNVGNIRGVSPAGAYHVLRGAWELVPVAKVAAMEAIGWSVISAPPQAKVTPGTVCMLPPPAKQGFSAYQSLDEGVVDYLDVMRRNFKRAWAEMEDEDSDSDTFVEALKADRYFTGDLTQYKTNVRAGVSHALRNMPARPEPAPVTDRSPTWTPVEVPAAVDVVATLADDYREIT